MREFIYTPEERDVERERCLPLLRDFVAECRRKEPIPSRGELSVKDRCRLRLYKEKMRTFKPYSPFSVQHVGLLLSDVVGLLASRKIFGPHLDCLVLLTGDELAAWHKARDDFYDLGFWYFGWRIHTTVPPRLKPLLAGFPMPGEFEYWVFTSILGASASHELWRYDGRDATVIEPSLWGTCSEEGPIDEWYDGITDGLGLREICS